MPTIKVRDLAWARLHAPDLDAMEEFLTHFGLIRSARTPTSSACRRLRTRARSIACA